MKDIKQELINQLSSEPIEIICTAYAYAKNVHQYGVDITAKWETATENAHNLELAYKKGFYEAMALFR